MKRSRWFAAAFIFLLILFVIVELAGIFDPAKGDTFTELVLGVMTWPPMAVFIFALWVWLGYHFFIEPRRKRK